MSQAFLASKTSTEFALGLGFFYSLNVAAQPTPQAVGFSGLLDTFAQNVPIKSICIAERSYLTEVPR